MTSARFGLLAATTTVTAMYIAFATLGWFLNELSIEGKAAAGLVGILFSIGFYRWLCSILFSAFARNLFFRKWALGSAFVEGTWIGHYEHDGRHFYTVEHLDQVTGDLKVSGVEYSDDLKPRAKWKSDAAAIDMHNHEVIYAYTCDMYELGGLHHGVGRFSLIRQDGAKVAKEMEGYSIDTIDGKKDQNREFKISDKFVGDQEALKRAQDHFITKAVNLSHPDGASTMDA